MELTRDLTAEQVDFTQEKKILSDIAQEAREQDAQFATYSEDELFEKVEAILVERIKSGEKNAYFQLGLLLFEKVVPSFFSSFFFQDDPKFNPR